MCTFIIVLNFIDKKFSSEAVNFIFYFSTSFFPFSRLKQFFFCHSTYSKHSSIFLTVPTFYIDQVIKLEFDQVL